MIVRKIMLLGEMGVGKSSIARRLRFDTFEAEYKATIGADIYRYEVVPSPTADPFHFLIWDTDGNFGSAIFRHVHMKEANAAFIVGDLSRPRTLATMIKLAEGFADSLPGRYGAFCLNKHDLVDGEDDPAWSLGDAMSSVGFPVFRTSARTGSNVKQAFHDAASTIARRGL